MARVDVLELKSFQKISLNEVRYLSEIDLIKSQPTRAEDAAKKSLPKKPANLANELRAKMIALTSACKSALNAILYETVPHCDTYSPE